MSKLFFSGRGLMVLAVIAAAGYYLLVEHRAHLVYFLPYGFFLLCPLMHFFMHKGHSGREDHIHNG